MSFRLCFCVATLVALVSLPPAIADLHKDLGPFSVESQNITTGDGCEGALAGSEEHYLTATVALTAYKSIVLYAESKCFHTTNPEFTYRQDGVFLMQMDGGYQTSASGYQWTWADSEERPAPICIGTLLVASTVFSTGCPSPWGTPPPLLLFP